MSYHNGGNRGPSWPNNAPRNFNTREDNNSRNNNGNHHSNYNGQGNYDRRNNQSRYPAHATGRGRGSLHHSAAQHPVNPPHYQYTHPSQMYLPQPNGLTVPPAYQQVVVMPDNNTYYYNPVPSPDLSVRHSPMMTDPNRLPSHVIPIEAASYQRHSLPAYSPTNIDVRFTCPQCCSLNTNLLAYVQHLEGEVQGLRKQLGYIDISEVGGDPSRSSSSLSVDATPFVATDLPADSAILYPSYNPRHMVLSNQGHRVDNNQQPFNSAMYIEQTLDVQQPVAEMPAEIAQQSANYNQQSSYVDLKQPDEAVPRVVAPSVEHEEKGDSREEQQAQVLQKTIEFGLPPNLNQSINSNDGLSPQLEWETSEVSQVKADNWNPPNETEQLEPVVPDFAPPPVVSASATSWGDEVVETSEEANRSHQNADYSQHDYEQPNSTGQYQQNRYPNHYEHNNQGQGDSRRPSNDRFDNRGRGYGNYKHRDYSAQGHNRPQNHPYEGSSAPMADNWRKPSDGDQQHHTRGNYRGGARHMRQRGGNFHGRRGQAPGANVQFDDGRQQRDFNQPRGGLQGNGDGQRSDARDQSVKREDVEEAKQEQEPEEAVQPAEEKPEPDASQKKPAGGARKKKEQEGGDDKEGSYRDGGGYQGNRRPDNRGQQKWSHPPRSDQGRDKPCKFITEVSGDLFSAPEDFSLAHCVAADMRMGAGIAILFRSKFSHVGELLDQLKSVGEVAILEDKGRFIYYLVTKENSWGKPTMESLRRSLTRLRQHCVANKVKNLAMPKIGCGLDRLEWPRVRSTLEDVFANADVNVTVYSLPENDNQSEAPTPSKKSLFYVKNERMNLCDIEKGTGLVYFCSEEGGPTETMNKIDAKYRFLHTHRAAKRTVGDVVAGGHNAEFIYGLVVKKRDKDPMSYAHLIASCRKFRKMIEKDQLGYFGVEAFRNCDDPLTIEKVVTCLRVVFGGCKWAMEAWCCWPKELESDHNWDMERPAAGSDTVAPQ